MTRVPDCTARACLPSGVAQRTRSVTKAFNFTDDVGPDFVEHMCLQSGVQVPTFNCGRGRHQKQYHARRKSRWAPEAHMEPRGKLKLAETSTVSGECKPAKRPLSCRGEAATALLSPLCLPD